MRDKIWILLFLLVACQAKNKEDIQKYNEKINFVKEGKQKVENKSYSAKNYINLEKFNSEYSYWDMINEYLKISSKGVNVCSLSFFSSSGGSFKANSIFAFSPLYSNILAFQLRLSILNNKMPKF